MLGTMILIFHTLGYLLLPDGIFMLKVRSKKNKKSLLMCKVDLSALALKTK